MAAALAKDPRAFETKGTRSACACKRSRCLKRYCECFEAARSCRAECVCVECENYPGSSKVDFAGGRARARRAPAPAVSQDSSVADAAEILSGANSVASLRGLSPAAPSYDPFDRVPANAPRIPSIGGEEAAARILEAHVASLCPAKARELAPLASLTLESGRAASLILSRTFRLEIRLEIRLVQARALAPPRHARDARGVAAQAHARRGLGARAALRPAQAAEPTTRVLAPRRPSLDSAPRPDARRETHPPAAKRPARIAVRLVAL